jgi:hypothetical protein
MAARASRGQTSRPAEVCAVRDIIRRARKILSTRAKVLVPAVESCAILRRKATKALSRCNTALH